MDCDNKLFSNSKDWSSALVVLKGFMRRSCFFFNEDEVLFLENLVRITAADITPANVEAAIKNDASSKGGSLFYINARHS